MPDITILKHHKHPAPGDHSIRYSNAHACEVDQGPEGNQSLFEQALVTPPSQVARDPRGIRQGGSAGGASVAPSEGIRVHILIQSPISISFGQPSEQVAFPYTTSANIFISPWYTHAAMPRFMHSRQGDMGSAHLQANRKAFQSTAKPLASK